MEIEGAEDGKRSDLSYAPAKRPYNSYSAIPKLFGKSANVLKYVPKREGTGTRKLLFFLAFTLMAFAFLPTYASFAAPVTVSSEMTNHVYSSTCQPYASATIIDRYDTNFTVTDSKGLREWRVGFVASDSVHHYYLESFFEELPESGTFEGASAAIHFATMTLYTRGALTENVSIPASSLDGSSQLPIGVPNRSIIAGDLVDFFMNVGYLQVFWYQTNSTISNQQQIFSANIQLPKNFEITDEYQIFTPVPGANSISMTNFEVAIQAGQISNVLPHIALTFSEKAPRCSLEPTLKIASNLCFENPVQARSNGKAIGISETMFSSDIDPS